MEAGFCSHLLFFLEVYLNTEKCTDPVYSWVGFHVHMYVQSYSRSRPRHVQCPGKLSLPHLVTTHLPPLASDHGSWSCRLRISHTWGHTVCLLLHLLLSLSRMSV